MSICGVADSPTRATNRWTGCSVASLQHHQRSQSWQAPNTPAGHSIDDSNRSSLSNVYNPHLRNHSSVKGHISSLSKVYKPWEQNDWNPSSEPTAYWHLLATFVLLFSIWEISHVQQKLISEGLMFVLYSYLRYQTQELQWIYEFHRKKNVVSWRRGASGLAFLPSPPCSENPTAPAWTVLQCPGPNGRRVHFGSVLETRHIAYD